MRGVFLDKETVDRGDVSLTALEQSLDHWDYFDLTSPADIAQRIEHANVIVTNKVVLDANLLAAAKQLKLICIAATGTNNIDLAAAKQLGIAVCNVRSYSTPSVVQHTFSVMLSLMMHLKQYQTAIQQGAWQASPFFSVLDYPIHEISGKKLGIIGYGELGKAVAHVATAFGMEVLVAARKGSEASDGRIPLHELLPQVDVLSLHCPLTPETRNLIGENEIALMKSTALLLNIARGGIVDESALANALKEQRLAGAGIDVLNCEPPKADNPLLASNIPNLLLTPHIAWASVEARQRLVNEISQNINSFIQGTPRNKVN